ncbi:efflux RND transporter periplasmic adaptor subunit [Aquimarina sp. 2-A2]|uniref:efflux RND transporter periplasmic adaptor subunit n=1 Tax=Aquimarina sp. 2-A2 TaxID=3382644 RepID=UPI00387EEB20
MNRTFSIFFLLLNLHLSCAHKKEAIFPSRGLITESVYSSVTVQPDSLYQAYATVQGILDANLVEEGDLVSKNEAILKITNTAPRLNAENAALTYQLAKENYQGNAQLLKTLKNEIEAATLKVNNDSINYYRQKSLWNQNIGSKIEYDTKYLTYQLSSNTLKQLKTKYQQTKNELSTQVKQSKNLYKNATVLLKDHTIVSKIDGKIYAIYKNPGELVNTMEPLAAIGNATVFVLEMLVDEVDIVKIKKDQNVLVTLDAYNQKVFEASVHKIYPKKDQRNQTFTVEAYFKNPPEILYPGLAGEANIIIASKDNSLFIPKEYLIENQRVSTDSGEIKIVKGIENMEYVEIVSGLEETTQIYKPD